MFVRMSSHLFRGMLAVLKINGLSGSSDFLDLFRAHMI